MSTPRYKKPHINKFHPQLASVSDIILRGAVCRRNKSILVTGLEPH